VAIFTMEEKLCIQLLADEFNKGEIVVHDGGSLKERLKTDQPTWERTIRTLRTENLISSVEEEPHFGRSFVIADGCVQVARGLAQEEAQAQANAQDILEWVKTTLRTKPYTAWPIAILLGLTVLVTFVNQLLDLLSKFGIKLTQ
jgi:hypothetical protein